MPRGARLSSSPAEHFTGHPEDRGLGVRGLINRRGAYRRSATILLDGAWRRATSAWAATREKSPERFSDEQSRRMTDPDLYPDRRLFLKRLAGAGLAVGISGMAGCTKPSSSSPVAPAPASDARPDTSARGR